jgi:beta-aspartyl-peptidase (threonine type)
VILIASRNGSIGMDAAWDVLERGGSALDAVETGTRLVEDNPDDHTVGYGGYPNLLGEVELDASIMDGATLRAGAVGALRGYRAAISVARHVMERLPHVLLAGDGAAQFAAALGLPRENLLTDEARQAWRSGIEGRLPGLFRASEEIARATLLQGGAGLATDPEQVAGTVNFLAQDSAGHIASAVSTSGWAWKYPGRVGDSPVIGAGNYADDRYGAATCTGWGELALRSGLARCVVLYLKLGYTLEDACRTAFAELADFVDTSGKTVMSMLVLDSQGNHYAVSTAPERTYVYRTSGMAAFAEAPRLVVPLQAGEET